MPPEVKISSLGCAPTAAAIASRASSTTLRAARPEPCSEDALPVRPSSRVMASTASGTIGVVAAWSK